jgi:hypothetical protein
MSCVPSQIAAEARPMKPSSKQSPLQAGMESQTFYCVDSGDGTHASPFWLTDVSARGARLMGRSVADMPDAFQLRVKGHEDGLWQCQVVWRSDNEIGIAILRSGTQRD